VLGMPIVSQLRTAKGISYCLQSKQAMIVCTAPLEEGLDLPPVGQASHFHDGLSPGRLTDVRSIGFQVDDPDAFACRAAELDVCEPAAIQPEGEGAVEIRMPDVLGDLGLRLVKSPVEEVDGLPSGAPVLFDGFEPIEAAAPRQEIPGAVIGIDHVAINVPDADATLDKLKKVLAWTHFRSFDERRLARPLRAVTIGSPTTEGLLTVVQPTAQRSVFQQVLQAHGGVSVHHIALRCSDIIRFADHMAGLGHWSVMPPPDRRYYDEL
jgi:4-hydroxyphenylpyruvate dioxygenase-like putative hemolysin